LYSINIKRRNSWPPDVSALDALNAYTWQRSGGRQAAMSHNYFPFRTTTFDSSGQNYFFKWYTLNGILYKMKKEHRSKKSNSEQKTNISNV
jgi:hypothetical protein